MCRARVSCDAGNWCLGRGRAVGELVVLAAVVLVGTVLCWVWWS
jgi:hypothetical protein